MTFIHWKVWFPGMQQIQFIYINTFLISNGKYQLLFLNYNYKFSDFLFFFLKTIYTFRLIFSSKILLKHNYLFFSNIYNIYIILFCSFIVNCILVFIIINNFFAIHVSNNNSFMYIITSFFLKIGKYMHLMLLFFIIVFIVLFVMYFIWFLSLSYDY